MLGHLDVYSWSGGHCGGIIEADIRQGSAKDARQTCKAAYSRFRQFYRQFYRHRLSFTDTRMAFAGFIGLYGYRVQLFLVLATYYVVLGPIPSAEHLIERTLTHLSP